MGARQKSEAHDDLCEQVGAIATRLVPEYGPYVVSRVFVAVAFAMTPEMTAEEFAAFGEFMKPAFELVLDVIKNYRDQNHPEGRA